MPSKYCGKLPRCKNSWWCATDFRPIENAECFTAMTNYDRIISKTPEDLADFLWSIGNNPATGNYYLNGKLLFSCADGNGWLDWLRQEVTDGA